MAKRYLILGSILAVLGVLLGAFGAHLFREVLMANGRIDTFETAVQYHQLHALAILFCSLLIQKKPDAKLRWVNLLFASGIFIFSGSLYLLSLTNVSVLGAITPIGGICFLAGWGILIYFLVRNY